MKRLKGQRKFLIGLAALVSLALVPAFAKAQVIPNNWLHFRGDVQNTGAVTQVAELPFRIRWSKFLGTTGGQVIALGGTLYVSSILATEPAISSYNLVSGALIWSVTMSGAKIPHLATDGLRLYANPNAQLISLDLVSGNPVWTNTEAGSGFNPISVAGGVVFTDISDGTGLIAVDAETGSTLWKNLASAYNKSAAAVVGATLFIGAGYSANWYALRVATGQIIWSYPVAPNYISSSPSVENGVMYGMGENGIVYALDIFDGSLVWSTDVGIGGYNSPAVHDGGVYVTSQQPGAVVKLDAATGATLWTASLVGEGWGIGSTVAGGHVFTADDAGWIYAVNELDGTVDWSMTLPGGIVGGGNLSREPVPVNGYIAIADDSGTLTVFETAVPPPPSMPPPPTLPDVSVFVKIVGGVRGYVSLNRGESATILVKPSTPGAITVRIYDGQGAVVKELTGEYRGGGAESFEWDGRDPAGDKVPSGIYPVTVSAPGIKYSGKLAVVR